MGIKRQSSLSPVEVFMGYHVVLENSIGGELDGRFAANEDDIGEAVASLARECVFAPGDTIRIIEAAEGLPQKAKG
jgi:hypothetical protein